MIIYNFDMERVWQKYWIVLAYFEISVPTQKQTKTILYVQVELNREPEKKDCTE